MLLFHGRIAKLRKRKKRMPEWESGITTSFAAMTCCASTMGSNSSWRKGVNMSKAISRKEGSADDSSGVGAHRGRGLQRFGWLCAAGANLPDSGSERECPASYRDGFRIGRRSWHKPCRMEPRHGLLGLPRYGTGFPIRLDMHGFESRQPLLHGLPFRS